MDNSKVKLSRFNNGWYDPGRGFAVRLLWFLLNGLLFKNPLNMSSSVKVRLLRLFGAQIGVGVILKPGINVKYPWNLEVGDHSWIGENAWIDSLDKIKIGNDVCISQGTYFCTGNHDWSDPCFGLILKPIVIEDGAWVGARSTVLPGVTVASHSIIAAGTTIAKDTEPYMIYSGNPATAVKKRVIKGGEASMGNGQ